MSQSFNQAKALIDRLMEGVGGSADAYEAPIKQPREEQPEHGLLVEDLPAPHTVGIGSGTPPPENPENAPKTGPVPEGPEYVPDEGMLAEDACGYGAKLNWNKFSSPDPISDQYECAGAVEESEELMSVFYTMERAIHDGLLNPVKLDTGTYNLEKRSPTCFRVTDTGKNREYISEPDRALGELVNVPENHLFVWVLNSNDRDGDELGYIQDGWVFLRKA